MREFIKANRVNISLYIKRLGGPDQLNDEERADWVRNDEGLYRRARREGVRV